MRVTFTFFIDGSHPPTLSPHALLVTLVLYSVSPFIYCYGALHGVTIGAVFLIGLASSLRPAVSTCSGTSGTPSRSITHRHPRPFPICEDWTSRRKYVLKRGTLLSTGTTVLFTSPCFDTCSGSSDTATHPHPTSRITILRHFLSDIRSPLHASYWLPDTAPPPFASAIQFSLKIEKQVPPKRWYPTPTLQGVTTQKNSS